MQDLNDMVFFAEVVERGGFAAAGRALGVPKSKLSRRVAELEGRLGVRLLQRTTRKLSLTQAGELYHSHCLAVREEARAADEAVARVQSEPRGTIRVSCPVTLAQLTIGPLIPRFLQLHPRVRIDMLVTNRVIDLVEESVDVALRVRSTWDDSGSLVVKNLGPTQTLLVAGPALLRDHDPVLEPQALSDLPRVAMSSDTVWRLQGPGGRGFELKHRPIYSADDLLTLKIAVLQGVGMCVLPDYLCAEEVRRGELVPVLPGWAPVPASVLAVFTSRRGMVPAVRRFLDFLGENMRGEQIVEQGAPKSA